MRSAAEYDDRAASTGHVRLCLNADTNEIISVAFDAPPFSPDVVWQFQLAHICVTRGPVNRFQLEMARIT